MIEEYLSLQNKLKIYIQNIFEDKCLNEEDKIKYLYDYRLQRILKDIIQNKDYNFEILRDTICQHIANDVMKTEIATLVEFSNKENIKLVSLKGVCFADKYYLNPENRVTGDIDILLDRNDFKKFMLICKNNGYTLKDGEPIEDDMLDDFIHEKWLDQHFNEIVKHDDSRMKRVTIDVHVRLFQLHWFGKKCDQIPAEFLLRSIVCSNQKEIHWYELELHDMLIYHQIHFIQHMLKDVWRGFIDGNFSFQKKINLLFDIACIVQNNNINWTHYIELSFKYELNSELALVCVYVNEIFGNIFPITVINSLKQYRSKYSKELFYDSFTNFLVEIPLRDLLFNFPDGLMNHFVNTVILANENSICKISSKIESSPQFFLDGKQPKYLASANPIVAKKMTMGVSLSWNNDYLIINIDARYNRNSLLDCLYTSIQVYSEYIHVVLFDPLANTLQTKIITLKFYKRQELIEGVLNNGNYEISNPDGKSIITLILSWKELSYYPQKGTIFGFSIEWCHYEQSELQYAIINNKGNPTWHDIMGLEWISLE